MDENNKKQKRVSVNAVFIILVIAVLGVALFFFLSRTTEKNIWDESIKLCAMLPEPKSEVREISLNNEEYLNMTLKQVSNNDFEEYITKCEKKGYTEKSSKSEFLYTAYNAEGWQLSLIYTKTNEELNIMLIAPKNAETPNAENQVQETTPENK